MKKHYETCLPGATHWSFRARRGTYLKATDVEGGANLGALFYNPEDLLERYNAPDTLKCQHSFKLTAGHCLYSDMGRIFCSIIEDSFGWHDTVCANANADLVTQRWGLRDYQNDRNNWNQNGYDAFLVELEKYGLGARDLAANLNLFCQVSTDEAGNLKLTRRAAAGDSLTLRFEMDTLIVLHTCPHPLDESSRYPRKPVQIELGTADPVAEDDLCLNHCDENRRGFQNNQLYYLGAAS